MAQHDFGGSCTAHKYCHSEARISGQVMEEQAGLSENRATMIELTFCIRKRQSSYSHSVLSTFSGGSASLKAISLSTAIVPFEPIGWVRKLWSALRCSVSWKAESICRYVSTFVPHNACVANTPLIDLPMEVPLPCLRPLCLAVFSAPHCCRGC